MKTFVLNGWAASERAWDLCRFRRDRVFGYVEEMDGTDDSSGKGFLIVAGVVWALAMGILFGVPLAYGYMTDHPKALSREHARAYSEVKEMRDKVRLVQKYSDHSRSALEILKAVSDRLPAGVELTSWNFRRGESVRVSGEASETSPVYQFKDRLVDTGAFEGGVTLSPIRSQGGKQKFDIECKFVADEEGLR